MSFYYIMWNNINAKKTPLLSKIEIRTWNSIKSRTKCKKENSRREDSKKLIISIIYEIKLCVLSFDDLKINEILMEAQGCFVWGRQIKIIIVQHGKYVLIAVKTLNS